MVVDKGSMGEIRTQHAMDVVYVPLTRPEEMADDYVP
jgi:hypothetical protein